MRGLLKATVVLIGANSGGLAAELNGSFLYETCNGKDIACKAYLDGVFQTLSLDGPLPPVICTKGNVSATQLYLVFKRYAEQHPERLSQPGAKVAADAFKSAFACN